MTDHNEAMRLADFAEQISNEGPMIHTMSWPQLAGTYQMTADLLRQQAERIAELEGERDQLRAEVERLKPNAERWEYALNSEEFAVCEWGSVFGEPCWVPISEESAIDAARTQKDEG